MSNNINSFQSFCNTISVVAAKFTGKPCKVEAGTKILNGQCINVFAIETVESDSDGSETVINVKSPTSLHHAMELAKIALVEKYGDSVAGASEELTALEARVTEAAAALNAAKEALTAAKRAHGSAVSLMDLEVPALDERSGGRPPTELPEGLAEKIRASYTAGLSVKACVDAHKSQFEKLTAAIVSRVCEGIDRKVVRAKRSDAAPAAPAPAAPAPEVSVEQTETPA